MQLPTVHLVVEEALCEQEHEDERCVHETQSQLLPVIRPKRKQGIAKLVPGVGKHILTLIRPSTWLTRKPFRVSAPDPHETRLK